MKVSQIMQKKFEKLYEHEDIDKAIKKLVSIPQSSLPVINKKTGKLIGELEQRELLLKLIGFKEMKSGDLNFENIKDLLGKEAKNIDPIVNRHEITVEENDDLQDAIRLMYDEGISSVPVLNSKGELVGLLTDIEILKLYKQINKNG